MLRKKRPRRIVPTARFKQIQLVRGPSIHVRAFHRRDVHAQRSMDPRAIEAYKHAEIFRRPFRVRRVAIEAQSVAFFAVQRVEQFVAVVLRRHYDTIFFSFLLFLPSLCLCICVGGAVRVSLSLSLPALFFFFFFSVVKLFSRKGEEILLFRVFTSPFLFFPRFFKKHTRAVTQHASEFSETHAHTSAFSDIYIYRHTHIFKKVLEQQQRERHHRAEEKKKKTRYISISS